MPQLPRSRLEAVEATTIGAGINMLFKVARKKKTDQAAHVVNQLKTEQSLRSQMQ